MSTKIEWTEHTWNVASGCTKVSDGCVNCYIERTPPFRMAHRKFDQPGIGGTTGVQLHPERIAQPLSWKKPRMVFVNSLTDLFHKAIPDEFIAHVFAVMALTPQHTYQVLTKRHGRMRSLLNSGHFVAKVWGEVDKRAPGIGAQAVTMWPSMPLPNVWLGVSVENEDLSDIRIPALLDTPAAVRFLSCEPLLGPISFQPLDHTGHERDYDGGPEGGGYICLDCSTDEQQVEWETQEFPPGIDWAIVGGESGPGARPMDVDWAQAIVTQCRDAKVPVFVKQLGTAWARDWTVGGKTVAALGDRKGGDMQHWPEELRVREFPQAATR